MLTMRDVQAILAERGVQVSIGTLRRWARLGIMGGMWGKRDHRWLMRNRDVYRLAHGLRADEMRRNGLTLRAVPRPRQTSLNI